MSKKINLNIIYPSIHDDDDDDDDVNKSSDDPPPDTNLDNNKVKHFHNFFFVK